MAVSEIVFSIQALGANENLAILITDGASTWKTPSNGVELSSPNGMLYLTSLKFSSTEINIIGGSQKCDIALCTAVQTTLQSVSGESVLPPGVTVFYSTDITPQSQLPNGNFSIVIQ